MKRKSNRWFSEIIAEIERIESDHDLFLPGGDDEPEERWWSGRNKALEHLKWKCPVCQRVLPNSRQWVVRDGNAICKSCWSVEDIDVPDITIIPEYSKVRWIPDPDLTMRDYADRFGVSAPTVMRWMHKAEIPIEYATDEETGQHILARVRIEPILALPTALGISRKTFGELVGYAKWRQGSLPVSAWKRLKSALSERI